MAYFHTTVLDNQIKALPTVDTASGSVATFDTDLTENLIECVIDVDNSETKAYLVNMTDISNITYFKGVLLGTYGFVDLGSLNYTFSNFMRTTINNMKYATSAYVKPNLICHNYETSTPSATISTSGTISTGTGGSQLWINDSNYGSGDEQAFKNAMSGVYLIYELITPTPPTFSESDFNALLSSFNISGWCFEYDFGETVTSGATVEAVSGTLTRSDTTTKSLGGNLIPALSENNIFASSGDVAVKYLLSVGKKIS